MRCSRRRRRARGMALGVAGTKRSACWCRIRCGRCRTFASTAVVLLFAARITLLSALVFGLVPALHAVRAGSHDRVARGQARRAGARNRLRCALVVTQLSFAVMLLVGAGLLLRSFLMMQRVDLGFGRKACISPASALAESRYPDALACCRQDRRSTNRLRANPAVRVGGGDGPAADDWRRPGHHGDSCRHHTDAPANRRRSGIAR